MKNRLLLLFPLLLACSLPAMGQSWKTNVGIEGGGWWGLSGMTPLQNAKNPLVETTLGDSYSWSADLYFDFWQLHQRQDNRYGQIAPGLGIKTKLDWEFFEADNGSGGNQSIGLNFIDLPLLFEYCLSFHEGISRAFTSPGSSYTTEYDHPDYTHIITTTTAAQYHPAGPSSNGLFIYGGPQICYLFKSFNDTQNGDASPINNPNLKTTYIGLVGGFTFFINRLSFDISYQRGLQSIYSGKDVYVNGFMFKLGINFSSHLLNTR